jgi:hypothetical protein
MRRMMILATLLVVAVGGLLVAQESTAKGDKIKAKWETLTPAQQEALRAEYKEKAKEKWDSMTPEEREAAKTKFKGNAKARWEKMTPEEREAAKAKIKENREKRKSEGK